MSPSILHRMCISQEQTQALLWVHGAWIVKGLAYPSVSNGLFSALEVFTPVQGTGTSKPFDFIKWDMTDYERGVEKGKLA